MKAARKVPVRNSRRLRIFLGLALTLLAAFLFFLPFGGFEAIHQALYDLSMKIRGPLPAPPQVAIAAIDDASIARFGRWPWPRARIAELIGALHRGGAKLIALDLVFLPAEAERASGNDRLLQEAAARAGNVFVPFYFKLGEGGKKTDLPAEITASALLLFDDPKKLSEYPPPPASEIFAPVAEVLRSARGTGHINVIPDRDGKVRWDPLIIEYAGQYFPSFSLRAAAAALGLERGEIRVQVGDAIRLGNREIPTNSQGMMLLNYYGGNGNFPYYSAGDLISGKVAAEELRGKIVLVGVTAAGIAAGAHDLIATPFSPRFPGVEKHAHEIASILQGRFLSRPSWAPYAEFGLVLLLGLLLSFLLPRMSPLIRLVLSLAILLALGGVMAGGLSRGMWLKIFFPGLIVVLQYVLSAVSLEGGREAEEEPRLELGYTGVVDAGVHVEPDPAERTLELDSAGAPRKIGRYEILGELGHGAMGVVYKGRDPIIDRLVAIKTIRFDRLYESQEIRGMKERFFKEAQAAGKLSHPEIVTLYDVGEESGLSYMAMEFVEGAVLTRHTAPQHLLPPEEALDLANQAAEALDYAHHHGIVHRDIKPANIMRTAEGQVKVMDFGIAKLPTSTLTQTGSILGTPSYMSPEQIKGEAIDGRSDLFSLGCVLYELLTGKKPFQGENLSGLMYQITQGEPLPPCRQNPCLPPVCDSLLGRALAKSPESRYQSGKEMAQALRKAIQEIKES